MPRIDPSQLLKCLSVLLSSSGGIKSKDEVNRVANLMTKFSKKLVSKCIYVLILKSTEIDILDMFMSAGGWDLMFCWLSDGITAKNWPLVEELVELLLLCPVNIDRLKGNNCPKIIKLLSKDTTATEKVRELACGVVDQWLAIVREATAGRSQLEMEQEKMDVDKTIELSGENKGDDQLPIYKITIRDGQQVLAQVISDKSGPRVDTGTVEGTKPTSSEEEEEPIGKPVKKKSAILETPDPSDSGEDDEDWEKSQENKTNRKRPLTKQVAEKQKSLSLSKKRKGKVDAKVKPAEEKPPEEKVNPKEEKPKPKEARAKDQKLKQRPEKGKPKEEKLKLKDDKLKQKTPSKMPIKKPDNKLTESVKEKPEDIKARKEQEDQDRATLEKLVTPSISNVGRIPKKIRDDKEKEVKKDEKPQERKQDKKPVEPPKPVPKDPKKYNYTTSTEIRKRDTTERPKTVVKTFNSKFRSTGLEEAAPLPKNNKKQEKEEGKKSPKRSSPPPSKEEVVISEKKAKEEEKKVEKPITPPKPKPTHLLQEIDLFADALTAANTFKDVKKKKRRPSVSEVKKEEDKDAHPEDKAKHTELVKPKLKFYQDTLVTGEDIKEEEDTESADAKAEPALKDEEISSHVTDKELEDEMVKTEEAISNFVKSEEKKNVEREKLRLATGILMYVKKRRVFKKTVSWKSEDSLHEIKYFELDETERVNVTKNFTDMKQLERSNEREQLMLSRKLAINDMMEEKTHWRPMVIVDVTGDYTEPGKNSMERDIQYTRERTVVPAMYFSKKMIPDTPGDPDLEIHAQTEPIMIPLNDQTGNADSVISYKSEGWPEPKENPPPEAVVMVEPLLEPVMEVQPPLLGAPVVMDMRQPAQPMGFFQGGPVPMMGGPPPAWPPQEMVPQDLMVNMPMNDMPPFQANMNFMGPQPPMNFSPQQQQFPPHEARPHRPWFRHNAPPGQWRHQAKGGNNWNNKKPRTCMNIIKRGFCKIPHCAFKHPPPSYNQSHH